MNYSKFHNIVILLLAPVWLMSQEALVLDGVSGFPLEGVALFNSDKTKAIVTNQEGKAPLELFSDCLLYTSPSPRDRQKSRMPSSA